MQTVPQPVQVQTYTKVSCVKYNMTTELEANVQTASFSFFFQNIIQISTENYKNNTYYEPH